jgi:hypothetical protein
MLRRLFSPMTVALLSGGLLPAPLTGRNITPKDNRGNTNLAPERTPAPPGEGH